jgi:hypothetical protein
VEPYQEPTGQGRGDPAVKPLLEAAANAKADDDLQNSLIPSTEAEQQIGLPSGAGITSPIPGSYQVAAELSGTATYYNLPGSTTASGQPFDPNSMNAAMTRDRAPLGTNVQVRLQTNPGSSINVQVNDTGPFARDANGQPLHPLRPDPNIIIDLTPHAFDQLTNNNRALGRVPVIVTVPEHN